MRHGLKHNSCTFATSIHLRSHIVTLGVPRNMVSTRSKAKPKTASAPVEPKSALTKKANPAPSFKSPPTDLAIHAFATAKDFESFLDDHHKTIPGIWLKLARKSSGIQSIKTMEGVEVALCFGWINGQGKSFDEDYYLSRYTPRRPNSLWSELNVDLVTKMTEEGRMRPAGVEAVEAAKKDGRWERAYARPSDMVVPEDLQAALEENGPAKAFFQSLRKGRRYSVLHKIYTASPTARRARVNAVVDGLAIGRVPGERAEKS